MATAKPRPWVFHVLPIAGLNDQWFVRITRGNEIPKYTSESYPKRVAVRTARRDAALVLGATVKVHPAD